MVRRNSIHREVKLYMCSASIDDEPSEKHAGGGEMPTQILPEGRLRVMVAEDHNLVREGIKLVLSQRQPAQQVEIVAEAASGEGVLAALATQAIDLLVLDLGMPGITGSRWIRALRDQYPALLIIVMTANQDERTREAVLATGIEAYLPKQGDAQALLDTVSALSNWIKPSSDTGATKNSPPPGAVAAGAPAELLTRREQQILALIAMGATGPEVAERLFISPQTVRKHRENLMRKLEVHSTAGLVSYALKLGLA
ncbi:response regulator [Achromobacter marplatensis]|uniref:response regulator n=1 Tax=Achromobacter marplatensis TaxID=470868 RepID=UPI0039F710D5